MPYGGGPWATRGMPIGGSAALRAARALADKIRRVAATLLEADPDDSRLGGGGVGVSGVRDRGKAVGHLARPGHFRSNELKGLEPSLEATVHFTNAQPWTFTNGAHLAVVEVDAETGRVSVLRYVAVDDCGRVVNPALVAGQIAGGVVQGLGGALMEHCAYDGAGQPLCGTLMDYAVPTAADVPPLELHHLETPAPSIAGGYKGAGEAGTTGAPAAILNAVNDALAPFGVMITDQPITAERVVRAVREGGRPRGPAGPGRGGARRAPPRRSAAGPQQPGPHAPHRRARLPRPLRGAAAPARPRLAVLRRPRAHDRLLHARARHEALRPLP